MCVCVCVCVFHYRRIDQSQVNWVQFMTGVCLCLCDLQLSLHRRKTLVYVLERPGLVVTLFSSQSLWVDFEMSL